jgi:GH24 family phage-related lysozyme (muramidase)
MFAAFLDAAYNAGPGGVCNSRMARSVHAGHLIQACDGFYGWRTTARNRRTGERIQLPGLVSRREQEARLCMEGAL